MAEAPQIKSQLKLRLTHPQDCMQDISFIGGGRITSALVAGLRLAGDERRIVVYDRHPEKLRELRRESRVEIATDFSSALRRAHILVLAVRPLSMPEVLTELSTLRPLSPRLCVSLAAGIPLAKLRNELGGSVRWVRAMPSPVSRVGRGLTGLCFDRGWSSGHKNTVREFFSRVGTVIEVPEKAFDAFTVTYSSSHGYHMLKTLSQAARTYGLDGKTALLAAAHALGDAVWYWRESGSSLQELLHEAATPGGIAAAAMEAMDRAGYAKIVKSGLEAGISRAKQNAAR